MTLSDALHSDGASKLKHIVLFSGGACSSLVAQIVAKEQVKKDVIFLYTPTYSEHPDADRFREQVAKYLGIPITVQADGRNIWQLIDDNNCLPSEWMPFCTRILKQEQREKFLKGLDDYILYYGFDAKEYQRAQNTAAHAMVTGEKVKFPLIEAAIMSQEAKKIIQHDWKICLPEPYLYLDHNNCIPCWKGGKGHWQRVCKYYPDQFQKAIDAEKKIGYTVFKGKTLEQLRSDWIKIESLELFDPVETMPCLCSF